MTSVTDSLKAYYGRLEPFSDQGSEGIVWCIHDPARPGYEGLHVIEPGDLLTIFSDASRNEILWEGPVNLDFQAQRYPLPLAPDIRVQRIGGMTVHGVPSDMSPRQWLTMFQEHKPCTLVRPYQARPF